MLARAHLSPEIHAPASVSRATAARSPDRHFLSKHVASRGRARRICTFKRHTSSPSWSSPLFIGEFAREASRIAQPAGDFCTIAILSNVPSLYAESSRVSVLSVAFLISIQTLRLPLASFRPHLFPFRSQFLVEGSVPPRFVRLVTPELLHLSLFNLIPSLFDFLSHKFLFSSFSAGFFSSNTSKKVSRWVNSRSSEKTGQPSAKGFERRHRSRGCAIISATRFRETSAR